MIFNVYNITLVYKTNNKQYIVYILCIIGKVFYLWLKAMGSFIAR